MFPAKKKLSFSLGCLNSVAVSAFLFPKLELVVDLDPVVAPVDLEVPAVLEDVDAPAVGFRKMMMMRSCVMENSEPS